MNTTQDILNAYANFNERYRLLEEHYNMCCSWGLVDEQMSDSIYNTSCGNAWEFIDGTWEYNGIKYCPYCGGKIINEHKSI